MAKRQLCLLALLCATAGVGADVVSLHCGCPRVKPQLHGTFWRNSLTQNLTKLPDVDTMRASQEGRHVYSARNLFIRYGTTGAWPGMPAEVSDNFVDVHKGFVEVKEAGEYSFELSCQNGAILLIDGQVVVEFDGVHPMWSRRGDPVLLQRGYHAVEVWHFAGEGTSGLVLRWALPGTDWHFVVPAAQLAQCDCDTEAPPPLPTPKPFPSVEGGELAQLRADLTVLRDTVAVLDTKVELLRRDLADVRAAQAGSVVQGGGSTEGQNDVVQRLKGAVGAVTRQLIAYENRMQERVRAEGNSGLTVVRAFGQGTDAYHQASFTMSGPANAHNHANMKYTIGLGEFGAVLNGVQFTTRHNDYSLVQPNTELTAAQYTESFPPMTSEIEFPPVPPSVQGSVAEQVAEMREYFRAFHLQDKSIRADYDKYFKPNLCYLEGAWTEAQEDITEPFASDRHHIDADTWEDLNDKTNFLFNNGRKSLKENLPYLPTAFRAIHEAANGDVFEPRIGQWFYRISCVPIAETVPTKRFRVSSDLHQQVRQARPMTKEALAQTEKALFEVNPTPREQYSEQAAWPKGRTVVEFLDQLMEQVPGFEGPNGTLEDQAFGPMAVKYRDFNVNNSLNTARYTRYYSLISADAMGRRNQQRAYNDLMFAAQTTHKRISPQQACIDARDHGLTKGKDEGRVDMCAPLISQRTCASHPGWGEKDVDGGASEAKCVWAAGRCRYKKCWTQRWSYAIPLEVVYTSPLTNWNPYNIEYHEFNTPGYDTVTRNANGKSASTAFDGANRRNFFRTPAEFFQDRTDVDPADTSGGVTFAKDRDGNAHAVRASGHWLLFPEIEGVGRVRQRYPIMPVHEHGSTTWKEVKAVEELVVGKHTPDIANIISETRAAAYGQELQLTATSGHDHRVTVSPADMHLLQTGQRSSVRILSSTDTAHDHYVEVNYDASRPAGAEFGLVWCTMGNEQTGACPPDLAPSGCGTTGGGASCCYGRCPDGHGLKVLV